MPKLVDTAGPRNVPQEILDLRKSSLEFHHELGQPVIFKHKWNERDLREGRAQPCPYHDPLYDRDSDWDPYCFGTGYLGGWENGQIVWVTIADTQEDVFRLNEQGVLIHQANPGLVAPWNPPMGDGDLIITAEFDPSTWQVLDVYDRYTLEEVTPVTMRGPGFDSQIRGKLYVVNQQATIDKVPYKSNIYEVPIDFDYANVPVAVDPNIDPDNYPPDTQFASDEVEARIVGVEPLLRSTDSRDIRLAVAGTDVETEVEITIEGAPGGSHVYV